MVIIIKVQPGGNGQNSKVALKVLGAALGLAAAQYTFCHIYLR